MKTRKLTVLLIALFFSIVPQMSYAQKANIDSKALGEAMLRYKKGQIDLNTFSNVLHAKVAPSESVAEIKEIISSAQTEVKAQSAKSIDVAIAENESEFTPSKAFKTTAKAIENLDVSSFKNMNAYFDEANKIVNTSSLDKNGVEYAILSSALMYTQAYMEASLNNQLKIANPTSADAQLMVQGFWSDLGKSMGKMLAGAVGGAIGGSVGGPIGAALGACGGAITAGVIEIIDLLNE